MSPSRRSVGAWARFRRRPAAVGALAVLACLIAVSLFAEPLASESPIAYRSAGVTRWFPDGRRFPERTVAALRSSLDRSHGDWMIEPLFSQGPDQSAEGSAQTGPPPWAPDRDHPFGTDEIGRDVLARVVHGARVSLGVGLLSAAICLVLGLLIGALAGFYGGWTDTLLSRLMEAMVAFPTFFFILAVLGLARVRTLIPVALVIGFTRWTDIARLLRADILHLKTSGFVDAARTLGASDRQLFFRHLLPHALGPVWVATTFGVGTAISIESALSFLGFGAPPPTASWGELLTQGHRALTYPGAWWLVLFPGLALLLTLLSINLVGEGLRDALDPRDLPVIPSVTAGEVEGGAGGPSKASHWR